MARLFVGLNGLQLALQGVNVNVLRQRSVTRHQLVALGHLMEAVNRTDSTFWKINTFKAHTIENHELIFYYSKKKQKKQRMITNKTVKHISISAGVCFFFSGSFNSLNTIL